MRPRIFDLPEEPAELASWLDRSMVGIHLGEMIAELEAVHAGSHSDASDGIEAVLGVQAGDFLQRGLAVLPAAKLRLLLRNPRLLLDLQERVLLDGGEYWETLIRQDAEVSKGISQDWVVVQRKIAQRSTKPAVTPIEQSAARVGKTSDFWLKPWALIMTMAASLLGLLYIAELQQKFDDAAKQPVRILAQCGWNDDVLLSRAESTPDFLNHLADAAECVISPSDSAETFAKKLAEFRAGCTMLIAAVPRQKSLTNQADRDWLLERCRAWAGKLDVAIHELENDVPVERIRGGVDDVLKHLVEALRSHAKSTV